MPRRSELQPNSGRLRPWALAAAVATGVVGSFTGLFAQGLPPTLAPAALEQLRLLGEWKAGRSVAERKIDSQLLFALDRRAGRLASALSRIAAATVPEDGRVEIDVDVVAAADLAPVGRRVREAGGDVRSSFARFRKLRAEMPAQGIRPLAELPGVRRIAPARSPLTHAVVSEGDRTHAADRARNLHGVGGAGIKVCALSNGIDSLALSQAGGELPAVDVLPGQAGDGDEGTAMLEIVHDLAPEAALGYASAFGGEAQFAQNILDLAASGCRIIVDDVIYVVESPFQDGILAAAVDEVAAQGVLYLSSAGNEGNLDDATSGTWQGDFLAGPPLPLLPGMLLHDFGGGEVTDLVLKDAPAVALHWTDPFATAANDYDLYVVEGDLSAVVRFSNDTQDGTGGDDDPVEIVSEFGAGAAVGERLVVVRAAGQGRLFNLVAFRGELVHATRGALRGHAAAAGALAIGAAPAADPHNAGEPAGPYPLEFDAAQMSELFSADGPRRIFFSAQGGLLPGAPANDFSSTGGVVREKPELAAADGVATSVEGFERFFGTSAAAPHAAALAAVYWSALPETNAAGVRAAMLAAALDIEAPGTDPVTGHGLVDLVPMLAAAGAPFAANLELGAVVPFELAGNGDAVLDPGERWRLDIELRNVGGAAAEGVEATLAAANPWAAVQVATAAWGDLAPGAVAASAGGFEMALSSSVPCGARLPFALTALYGGGVAPETLPFTLVVGAPGTAQRFAYAGPPVAIPDATVRGEPGPPALAALAIGDLGGRVTDLDLSLDGDLCTTVLGATTVGIEHPFVSDLQIELVAPSGFAVPLVRFADGFGNHFCQTVLDDESAGRSIQSVSTGDNPFTGSFRPAKSLAQFDGEESEGDWTLRVTDWNPIDSGNVRAFSLVVTPAVCHAFTNTVEIPAAGRPGLGALALLVAAAALCRLARRPAVAVSRRWR